MRRACLLLAPALAAALRNIDRCEAIFLTNSACTASSNKWRAGVPDLLKQAVAQETLTAAIGPAVDGLTSPIGSALERYGDNDESFFEAFSLARTSTSLRPDGFGGSDGFGSQPRATEREPRAAWCVAFVTTFAECDGALRCGMRTLALPAEEGGWIDEDLEGVADACLDDLSELANGLDDLTTPGAYWLNPALPRDADGNKVDPTTGLTYTSGGADDEEDADAVLRDMNPR